MIIIANGFFNPYRVDKILVCPIPVASLRLPPATLCQAFSLYVESRRFLMCNFSRFLTGASRIRNFLGVPPTADFVATQLYFQKLAARVNEIVGGSHLFLTFLSSSCGIVAYLQPATAQLPYGRCSDTTPISNLLSTDYQNSFYCCNQLCVHNPTNC